MSASRAAATARARAARSASTETSSVWESIEPERRFVTAHLAAVRRRGRRRGRGGPRVDVVVVVVFEIVVVEIVVDIDRREREIFQRPPRRRQVRVSRVHRSAKQPRPAPVGVRPRQLRRVVPAVPGAVLFDNRLQRGNRRLAPTHRSLRGGVAPLVVVLLLLRPTPSPRSEPETEAFDETPLVLVGTPLGTPFSPPPPRRPRRAFRPRRERRYPAQRRVGSSLEQAAPVLSTELHERVHRGGVVALAFGGRRVVEERQQRLIASELASTPAVVRVGSDAIAKHPGARLERSRGPHAPAQGLREGPEGVRRLWTDLERSGDVLSHRRAEVQLHPGFSSNDEEIVRSPRRSQRLPRGPERAFVPELARGGDGGVVQTANAFGLGDDGVGGVERSVVVRRVRV